MNTDKSMLIIIGKGGWGVVKGKGVKYMVMKEDLILGDGYPMQYIANVS